jgi:hypothetical protein
MLYVANPVLHALHFLNFPLTFLAFELMPFTLLS